MDRELRALHTFRPPDAGHPPCHRSKQQEMINLGRRMAACAWGPISNFWPNSVPPPKKIGRLKLISAADALFH